MPGACRANVPSNQWNSWGVSALEFQPDVTQLSCVPDLDLYEDVVAPGLQSDLWVETWCRAPCLESYCLDRYRWMVENVDTMSLAGVVFDRSRDHSKWAIGKHNPNGWVCVGDLNRMPSQRKRGGGTVCLWEPTVQQSIYGWIRNVSLCDANSTRT